MRIGVDLMGSDTAPQILFQGLISMSDQLSSIDTLVIFATPDVIKKIAKKNSYTKPHIEFVETAEVIFTDDSPLEAVRHKKDSSLVVGVKSVAEKYVDAFVSTGNTGALIASSRLFLPRFPGIQRPALLALLPTQKGVVAAIDVGGNVLTKASLLVEFAKMGVAFQQCQGKKNPKIGLLNIGREAGKGTSEVREAYRILEKNYPSDKSKPTFIGNIEGAEIFKGNVDVLVSDGFTGNVFLKASEGISNFIFDYLKSEMQNEALLPKLQKLFNYNEYPGAIVAGVEGIIVKCHGYSSAKGLVNGIQGAARFVQQDLIAKLKKQL